MASTQLNIQENMGASESTAKSNGDKNEEEDKKPQHQTGETSMGSATAAAGAAFAAWGISKLLSDNTNTQETPHQRITESPFHTSPSPLPAGPNHRTRWSPPSPGRYKINTDGSCRPTNLTGVQRGPSGFGGILRDHNGKWVRGFIGFIGVSDCLTSEFCGILKGLELLNKLRLKGAVLETDSQSAFQWLDRRDDYRSKSRIVSACWPVIMKCRELIDRNEVTCKLIQGGNGNRCADKLADMGIESGEEYVEMECVPDELRYLVGKDAEF